jgi:hypothetical protein
MMEIRSYRKVFDLERRVYRIDRLRLNPAGVPVRGVVYFLAMVAFALVAASLPGAGAAVRALPWYARDLLLPALAATAMGAIRIDGRNFHHAASSLLRFGCGRRALVRACRPAGCRRWHPHDVLVLPNGSDHRLRSLRYTGPGAVFVAVAHLRSGRAVERGSHAWARRGRRVVVSLRRDPAGEAPVRTPVSSLGPGVALRVRGEPADAA